MSNKKYSCVLELLNDSNASADVVKKFLELQKQSKLKTELIIRRIKADISAEEMARKLGWTKSNLLSFEAGNDDDLTIDIIEKYLFCLIG